MSMIAKMSRTGTSVADCFLLALLPTPAQRRARLTLGISKPQLVWAPSAAILTVLALTWELLRPRTDF